ncbi:MAG: amidophosphoribosyltransferase [Planctomycetota bacterium]
MCGIVGIVAKDPVNQRIYDALTVLQHRGQDAAGIMTCDRGKFFLRKSNGLVRDAFRQHHMQRLVGNMGLGHVRYPTAGCSSSAEAQPFFVNSPYGISLAHNGNLTNAAELHQALFRTDLRHINTTSDSEVLLNVFAHELQELGKLSPGPDDIFEAVRRVHRRCKGAYAVVAMISGYGIVGFRDPYGIRPLIFGKQQTDMFDTDYMIASESVALVAAGYQVERDVAPGEAVFIDLKGNCHTRQCAPEPRYCPCIFEHVYLARPDSFLDDISIYKARLRMGEKLAEKVRSLRPDHDIDVVMPIPDSGRTAAMSMAGELGLPFREGFVKNRYIGRTFIMPGQAIRKKSVRQKLNPIELEFRGKNVMLVDDSIVRGTTCQQIIQMARESGAKKVYFGSAAPAVRHPNVYGIDMPAATELVAHGRTDEEVARIIGADWLVYQDLTDLIECANIGNPTITEFDCSVFDGRYVTGDVDEAYIARLSQERNDAAKNRKGVEIVRDEELLLDLHNDA